MMTAVENVLCRLPVALAVAASLVPTALVACSGGEDPPAAPIVDSGVVADSGKPDATKDSTPGDAPDAPTDAPSSDTKPPPIEDSSVEDYGTPVPGAHVEGTIGPSGGSLVGTTGPLAGVRLLVPAGALGADTLLALDALPSPGAPPGATAVSPFVRVGPDTVLFAVPARVTLPWKSAATDPQLAVVARPGTSLTWAALTEPSADAASVSASLGRGASVEAVHAPVASVPAISAVSPSTASAGSVVFVEGSNFGFAPVVRPFADGGLAVSQVTIGGFPAPAIGWSDTIVSVRMPAGDGGVVAIATPGGAANGGSVTP